MKADEILSDFSKEMIRRFCIFFISPRAHVSGILTDSRL